LYQNKIDKLDHVSLGKHKFFYLYLIQIMFVIDFLNEILLHIVL